MSQTSKRPGARDISDLKARLGLKKTGGATTSPGGPGIAPPGGVVPPPGGYVPPPGGIAGPPGSGRSIPAPPGLSVPQGAQHPFGTAQQPIARAPDIVIVNDGKPVENVSKQNRTASLGKLAAMVLGPLVMGVIIGKVSSGAAQYNQVISDAAPIRDNVKSVRNSLTELQATLESGKQGGKFVAGDDKLTTALAPLVEGLQGNDELVYTSSLYHLDPVVSREIYTFYSDIHALNAKLKAHIRAAKVESKALQEGAVKFGSFNPMAYGAVLRIPTADDAAAGAPVTFQVVQLGGPVCEGDSKPNPAGCQGKPLSGFAYRDDEAAGSWKVDKIAPATEAGIPTDHVVMLDPTTKVLKQIVTGAEASVSEIAYGKRIEEIATLTEQMLATGKKIETLLNEKSNEGGKFTFFL